MKYSEIERKLRVAGFRLSKKEGKHPEWFNPITKKRVRLSHHSSEEIPKGTLKKIIKESGIEL